MLTFKISLIRQTDEFLDLAPEWNSLLDRSDAATIFLTWEWMFAWYQHIFKGQQLWLITARNQKNNELLAIAPLMVQRRQISGFVSLRELCFLGSGVGSDHLDFILDGEHSEALINALTQFIQSQPLCWDLIHLEGCRNNAMANRILKGVSTNYYHYPVTCPYLSLPHSWDDYLKTLNKKRRYKIGAYRRRLEADFSGRVDYQCVGTIEELAQCLPDLYRLHQQAQQAQGRPGAFVESAKKRFHRQICQCFLSKDWLRLYFLRVDGKPVSVVYSYLYRDIVSFYTTGFDLEWSAYSPGQQIIYYVMEQSIKESAREFDFLRGDEKYKFMMTGTVREDYRIIAPQTPWGQAVACCFNIKKRWQSR